MSIKSKIGIGFSIMIVTLTALIATWGAKSLGIKIEEADLEKLISLREMTLEKWRNEREALAQIAADIAPILISSGFMREGDERLIGLVETLKRQLHLDWLDIRENRRSILYKMHKAAPIYEKLAVPQRIATAGPLVNVGMLAYELPVASAITILVARKPAAAAAPLVAMWDEHGFLYGNADIWPKDLLKEAATREATFQRIIRGCLYRLRSSSLKEIGATLLVGYEADVATITCTGIDELMLKVAVLEILGLLILGYFLGRRIFAPLERLKEAIDQVGKGNWQEIPLESLPDGDDEIGTLGRSFNRMVCELSQARDRLIEIQRELMSKEKMAVLGRFSASLAHEINNPLGTILASAGLAFDALKRQETVDAEDIENIIEETKRCRYIVESLLKYAHNLPPNLTPTPLSEIIETAANTFSKIPTTKVDIIIKNIPPIYVMADITGIEQVLVNLLKNAAEALQTNIKSGRAAVIRIEAQQSQDDFAIVTIADNGPGLGEAAEHLFEPLMTTKPQGTGLGLALCQTIIEGHGGRISASVNPQGWTEFTFTLRLVKPLEPSPEGV